MRTQPRVNEAITEKQAPWKISIKKKISHSAKWSAMKKSQQNKKEN